MRSIVTVFLFAMAPSLWVGCDAHTSGTTKGPEESQHHVHLAPHGGVLLPLGDHAFNLEFVLDRNAGVLDFYALDGHAENFVRLSLPSVSGEIVRGNASEGVSFLPVMSSQTGETSRDTSRFRASTESLKRSEAFSLKVGAIEIRGQKFEGQRVEIRQ